MCTSRLPTESLCLYVQKHLRTKAFTHKSLHVQKPLHTKPLPLYLLLFNYSRNAGRLEELSALLFSHCSPFLERFGLCRDGGLLGMTVGQSSRRGRGCGGLSSPSVVFSDSKDTELRTLEMTLPLCHVKSVRRHRGTEVRFASPLERCRASFLSIRF